MFTRITVTFFLIFLICLGDLDVVRAHAGHSHVHANEPIREKIGLMLLAHGAPKDEWNKPVLDLGQKVWDENIRIKLIDALNVSFLEFAQPDACQGIMNLEANGSNRIIVMPLFIAPSSHSHFDVPAALGLYSSPSIRAVFKEERMRIAKPRVPVTVLQTLNESDVLEQFALSELERLSKDPANEALIILAHGCPDHELMVRRKLDSVMTYCTGKKGITHAEWVCVGMGHDYDKAISAFSRALEEKEKTIVIGLYLCSSAASIHERAVKMLDKKVSQSDKLVFSDQGVITWPDLPVWILETVKTYIGQSGFVEKE